jgi:hypothetical protein
MKEGLGRRRRRVTALLSPSRAPVAEPFFDRPLDGR